MAMTKKIVVTSKFINEAGQCEVNYRVYAEEDKDLQKNRSITFDASGLTSELDTAALAKAMAQEGIQ